MEQYITKINDSGQIAVEDTILIRDFPTTAGAKILDGFVPLFSADAVERLEGAGYTVSGKANVGEFGLDLMGETSHWAGADESELLAPGAAAQLVARGEVKGALCVDLNGAPRRSAAAAGIDFIKPTYGTVSRYGVVPGACSAEQIGVAAANAAQAAKLLTVIAGHDDKDGTSLPAKQYDYALDKPVDGMRVAIIDELLEKADAQTAARVEEFAQKLREQGVTVEHVSLDVVCAAQAAWQILMAAEVCNNLSRYDGVKFGYRTENYSDIDELYIRSRTEGMGFLAKATILYGSNVLSKDQYDACYDKALRIRRVVREQLDKLFGQFDALLTPVSSAEKYVRYAPLEAFSTVYRESAFTALASLTGIPAIVTGGVQLMADCLAESTLLSLANSVETKEGAL